MQSKAATVKEYLASLPDDRRKAIGAVREVILKNLDKGFEEGMQYGMIGYFVPHRLYPAGYHCDPKQPLPYAGLASQKNYMSLYVMSVYAGEEQWLRDRWAKTGKKLDMGKCCIRFKALEDLPLDVVAEIFRRVPMKKHVETYESILQSGGWSKKPARKSNAKRRTAKKAKQSTRKKASGGRRG